MRPDVPVTVDIVGAECVCHHLVDLCVPQMQVVLLEARGEHCLQVSLGDVSLPPNVVDLEGDCTQGQGEGEGGVDARCEDQKSCTHTHRELEW